MFSYRSRRGFTLLELIVVIVILGILATLAVPTFAKAIERSRVSTELASLNSYAREVQALAAFGEGFSYSQVNSALGDLNGAYSQGVYAAKTSYSLAPGSDSVTAGGVSSAADSVGEIAWALNADSSVAAFATPASSGVCLYVSVNASSSGSAVGSSASASCSASYALSNVSPGSSASVPGEGSGSGSGPVTPAEPKMVFSSTNFSSSSSSQVLSPTLSDFTGPVSFSIEGSLPAGVSFDASTGSLTGPASWDKDVKAFAFGISHALALTENGEVWSWGSDDDGRLGLGGDASPSGVPEHVASLDGQGVVALAAGDISSYALTSDGRVFAWGSNNNGQLGSGLADTDRHSTPTLVAGALSGQDVVQVSASGSTVLARTASGTVYAWGSNSSGQMGLGDSSSHFSPTLISSLSGKSVTDVEAYSYASAFVAGGQVYTSGWGGNGRLGTGATSDRLSPTLISGALSGKNVVDVEGGNGFAVAETSDGLLVGWGNNNLYQLGLGDTSVRLSPVVLSGGALASAGPVKSFAVGMNHVLASTSDNSVIAWGYNLRGQIGDGTKVTRQTPGVILSGVVSPVLSASSDNSALISGKALSVWGSNLYGQVGTGSPADTNLWYALTPVTPIGFGGLQGWPFTVTVTASSASQNVTATETFSVG